MTTAPRVPVPSRRRSATRAGLAVAVFGLVAVTLWLVEGDAAPRTPQVAPASPQSPTRCAGVEAQDVALLRGRVADAPQAATSGGLLSADGPSPVPDPAASRFRPVPDDAPESGPCTLRLCVVDAAGVPLATKAVLWRLAAPASTHYSAGDQRQDTVDVPAEKDGAEIGSLPAGRYRVFLREQAVDADDPPAFVVGGAYTTVTVTMPRRVRRAIGLRVYDHEGREVLEGAQSKSGLSSFWHGGAKPTWLKRRVLRQAPEGVTWVHSGLGGGFGASSGRWRPAPVKTTAGIPFTWATFPDDGRVEAWRRATAFHRDGWSTLKVPLNGKVRADHTFVGVQVSLARLHNLFTLPSGVPVRDVRGGYLRVHAEARRQDQLRSHTPWLDLAVHVTAHAPGHLDVKRSFTLREGWPEPQELEPLPTPQADAEVDDP